MAYPEAELGSIVTLWDCLHKTPAYSEDGYPMVRVTDIKRGFLDLSRTLKVQDKTYQEFIERHRPRAGDILFSRVGSYGNSCFVGREQEFCLGQNTVCITPDPGRLVPYFLYCCLNTPFVRQQIDSLVGGASQPTISLTSIAHIKLPLPDIADQSKIAHILLPYDNLIENDLRRIEILEDMAQNLYREWFVKFRYPGHQDALFIDSPLGQIPEGWEVKGAMDNGNWNFIDQNVGPYEGTKRYHATADIDGITIVSDGVDYTYKQRPSRAQKQPLLNSVWFARMQETYKVLAVARPNATLAANAMLSSGFAGLVAADEDSLPFLFLTIASKEFHQEKDRYCTGATQRSLTNDGLGRIPTICPPREIVQQFGHAATDFIELVLTLQQQNLTLCRTRDLLLPKLISGEVDVSKLDIAISEEVET